MMLSQLFARRYLFSPKSHSVINIIAGISVFSVAIPVAAMVILLSVFNGFGTLAESMTSSFDPDITVRAGKGGSFEIAKLDTAAIGATAGIGAVSLIAEQNVLLEYDGKQAVTTLRGVDDNYSAVMPIETAVTGGRYEVRLGDLDRIIIGQTMAYTLGVKSLADIYLSVYSIRRGSFSSLLPLDGYSKRRTELSGIFAVDMETEQNYALTSLHLAQQLSDREGRATSLAVRSDGSRSLDNLKHDIEQTAGEDFAVKTRYELNESFYRIVAYEKWGVFFISLMVLIVASFSIVGTLVMLMIEKRNDIFTLRAMGADKRLIGSIFVGEGSLIGATGGAIGLALGAGLSLLQQHFGIIEIPAETFLIKSYPVELHLWDLATVTLSAAVVVAAISRLTVSSMIKRYYNI